jgi:hypothetical protein
MTQIGNQLKADGASIVLTNGTEMKVKYDMAAIIEIENKHGSVSALYEKLKQGDKGPIFGTLSHALWAGTNRKMPYQAFIELLNPKDVEQYSHAFATAIQEAFPTAEGDDSGKAETA